jgi:hypothetical protein
VRARTRTTALVVAAAGLTVAAASAWSHQATAAASFLDRAYGISATGAAPIGATPSVSSSDGQDRTATGGASSSDGTISIGTATVHAGGGAASAQVSGFTAFAGLVVASTVSASCDHGVVTSKVDGTPAGPLGRKGEVAYGVTIDNADGSITIIGMQVTITASPVIEASTINVAVATCAPNAQTPSPTHTPTTAPPGSRSPSPTRSASGGASPTTVPIGQPTSLAPAPSPARTHLPVTG